MSTTATTTTTTTTTKKISTKIAETILFFDKMLLELTISNFFVIRSFLVFLDLESKMMQNTF